MSMNLSDSLLKIQSAKKYCDKIAREYRSIKNKKYYYTQGNDIDRKIAQLIRADDNLHYLRLKFQTECEKCIKVIRTSPFVPSQQLMQDLHAKKSGDNCGICMEQIANIAFIPCGHITCKSCCDKVNKCPFCRKNIEEILTIYKS